MVWHRIVFNIEIAIGAMFHSFFSVCFHPENGIFFLVRGAEGDGKKNLSVSNFDFFSKI